MRFAFMEGGDLEDGKESTSGRPAYEPFVFTVGENPASGAAKDTGVGLGDDKSKRPFFGGGEVLSPNPRGKRELAKEVEFHDKYMKMNATVWFDSNARREQLQRELKEVLVEETQDVKSSIFSVQEQKETYQEELTKFVTGEKRKSGAMMSPVSPQMRALGSSLQALEGEIHRVKHQKLMEKAKQEAEEQKRLQREEAERRKKLELEQKQNMEAQIALKQRQEMERKRKEEEDEARKVADARAREERENRIPEGVLMSPSASKWQKSCASVYDKHKALAADIFKASKLERLKLEKPIKKCVNQVSCSRQQIAFVGRSILEHLTNQYNQGKHFYSYCLVRLGDLIALQGPGLGAAKQLAFAYAELVSMVSESFHDLAYVVVAALHKSCPLTVPSLPKGYKAVQTDIKGYISLWAALCQLQPKEWFRSSEQSWSWQARFLNTIPPNESTAIALDAFLQIAGHKSFGAYRKQQVKLFSYAKEVFLTQLMKRAGGGDEDIDAVKSRIEKYVTMQLYATPPKDSFIPETDDSQHIRC